MTMRIPNHTVTFKNRRKVVFVRRVISRCKNTFVVLMVLLSSKFCFAGESSIYGAFCGARDQMRHMIGTPINQMDNQTLFLSAEAMRNQTMSIQQRLINFYWLERSRFRNKQGTSAVRHVVRTSLYAYWNNYRSRKIGDTNAHPLRTPNSLSRWTDLDLDLSEDSIELSFSLKF